jgi:hypothetical protein
LLKWGAAVLRPTSLAKTKIAAERTSSSRESPVVLVSIEQRIVYQKRLDSVADCRRQVNWVMQLLRRQALPIAFVLGLGLSTAAVIERVKKDRHGR